MDLPFGAKRAAARRSLAQRQAEVTDHAARRLAEHEKASWLVSMGSAIARAQGTERVSLAAAGAAFWIIVAVFPAAIAAINIYGLVISPAQVAADISKITSNSSADSLGAAFAQSLQSAAGADTSTISISLAISIAVSVWGASAGFYSLARAIQLSYQQPPMNYLKARVRSVIAGFVGVLALGLLALVGSFGEAIIKSTEGLMRFVSIALIGVPALLILLTALIAAMYRFAIAHKTKVRALLPGAICAAVALLVLAVGFGLYVSWFGNYKAVYGAVAGVVIAMLLAYMSVYAVLLAAIFNAELVRRDLVAHHAGTTGALV